MPEVHLLIGGYIVVRSVSDIETDGDNVAATRKPGGIDLRRCVDGFRPAIIIKPIEGYVVLRVGSVTYGVGISHGKTDYGQKQT